MQSEALHLRYRPTTFSDMVGQRLHAVVLQQMADTMSVPSALLFTGPSGTGKTTAARILASAVGAGDVIEVDAASNGGVDQVRKLQEISRYATGGSYRVIILDEAHSITRPGFEAFLKTLEEPPENTIFVLCSTEPNKILKTVRSRLVTFAFKSITAGDAASRLAAIATREEIRVERDLVLHLANRANGDLRTAIQALDKANRAGTLTLRAYQEMSGEGDPAPHLLAALMTNDHAKIFAVVDDQLSKVASPAELASELISLVRDLFVIQAGGTLPESQGYELRKQLASRLSRDKLMLAVRVLWEVRTKINVSDDPRGNLDLALILVAEAVSRGNPERVVPAVHSEQPAPTEPRRKLTLAEMQRD